MHQKRGSGKSDEDYEAMMARALAEINRVLRSDGVLCLVFASKSWAAWETLVSSLIRSNFVIETMWPIQTEKRGRLRFYNSAALNASQHLICRPRRAGETRERKDFSEHQATLMSTLDQRILACIEQNIHGIDALLHAWVRPSTCYKVRTIERKWWDLFSGGIFFTHSWNDCTTNGGKSSSFGGHEST